MTWRSWPAYRGVSGGQAKPHSKKLCFNEINDGRLLDRSDVLRHCDGICLGGWKRQIVGGILRDGIYHTRRHRTVGDGKIADEYVRQQYGFRREYPYDFPHIHIKKIRSEIRRSKHYPGSINVKKRPARNRTLNFTNTISILWCITSEDAGNMGSLHLPPGAKRIFLQKDTP